MFKNLNEGGIRKVIVWLADHGCQTTPARLHRDFSDCIKIAEILKKIYPRLVNMNNYPKHNSIVLKIENWKTLNFKVLKKIGITLNEKRIANIAEAEPGAIDCLLYQIMLKDFELRLQREESIGTEEQFWLQSDDVVISNVKQCIQGEIVEKPMKLILYSIYKEKVLSVEEYKRQIEFMEQQIAHIENLKNLQEEHAKEIRERLTLKYGPNFANKKFEKTTKQLQEAAQIVCVPSLDLTEIASIDDVMSCLSEKNTDGGGNNEDIVGDSSETTRSEKLRCTSLGDEWETTKGKAIASMSQCTI